MNQKAIVLDANIMIRAVLGKRVREIILAHARATRFFTPDVAHEDARKYLPALLEKRGIPGEHGVAVLDGLQTIIHVLDADVYSAMKEQALERIALRDADDWPILACAMLIGCPIWTEDMDFFGTGVPTWTTDRVEIYL